MERVAARLHDRHHRNTGHGHFGIVARAFDLHFFERAVVEIDRGVLIRAHRDVHALDLELGLRQHAIAGQILSLRHRAATHVGNRLRDPRRHGEDVLQVAAARNRIEHFLRERDARSCVRDVDDRTLSADGDRFFHRAELQREIDACVETDGEPQVLT